MNVVGEGGPRREGLEIGPRIRSWSRFGSTTGTKGTELCVSMVREREIREAGLHGVHCTSLCNVQVEQEVGVNFELRPQVRYYSRGKHDQTSGIRLSQQLHCKVRRRRLFEFVLSIRQHELVRVCHPVPLAYTLL